MAHLICGACLRLRFSPIHWLVRALGFCPGDKYPRTAPQGGTMPMRHATDDDIPVQMRAPRPPVPAGTFGVETPEGGMYYFPNNAEGRRNARRYEELFRDG